MNYFEYIEHIGTKLLSIIWAGTQAQYEAIATKDATTIYLITES